MALILFDGHYWSIHLPFLSTPKFTLVKRFDENPIMATDEFILEEHQERLICYGEDTDWNKQMNSVFEWDFPLTKM